jgi:ABC-type polysaccharide/polyol phosphate export permease
MIHIISAVMLAVFYVTPILYPQEMIPEKYRWVFDINPFYYFVEMFRVPIIEGVLPPVRIIGVSFAISLGAFLIGLVVLYRYDNKIVFKL